MAEKHIPGRVQVGLECNQNCLFCSIANKPKGWLNPEEIKKRIITLKEQGTNDLFITGGEPTIYPDLFEILEFAEKTGFNEITIQTNGSNLTESFLEKLKEYKHVRLNISFHSFEEEIFNRLSNSTHYKTFLEGLKKVNDLNIPAFLTIVINKLNYKGLKDHIKFIKENFPNIIHFSLNFIDPSGEARKNKWIVPTLVETERYIHETVKYILSNGLTFRLERVPLCYMQGFEEFSTEARLPTFGEKRLTYFAEEEVDFNIEEKYRYFKNESCKKCFLNDLCPGLNPNYTTIHGSDEIFPVFTNPEKIILKIIGSKKGDESTEFIKRVYSDLALFKKTIKIKSNKNNIYDTYAHFLMENLGFRDEDYLYEAWKILTDKIRKELEPNLLSFYVHFPYCQSACDYCVYPSTQLNNKEEIEKYITYLIDKMKKFSPLFEGLKFKTLSMGGGTPSLMSESQLKYLLSNIFKYFDFEETGEKSIEFNPETSSYEKLKILDEFKFNKLSMGVQSLSPRTLKENNRAYQTTEKIKQTVSDFKRTEIGYLNIDLILGLRKDIVEDFLYSFEEICKMQPSNISIYPIKTNDDYIKPRYGNLDKFLDFYYPLFNNVTKELPNIAQKYGFISSYEDTAKLSYVHPFHFFSEKQKNRNIKYSYSNFKIEQYSNLGLGYYSESCINNMMRYIYVNKNNPSTMFLKKFLIKPDDFTYNMDLFLPNYSKVKFITHSVYEGFVISREDYKEMFKSDIVDDFSYAIEALKLIRIIDVNQKEIRFNVQDEKETYAPLLFFVGREQVLKKCY